MKETTFNLALSGLVRVDGDSIKIVVNRSETKVDFTNGGLSSRGRLSREGMTLNEIILEAAREVVAEKGFNRLRAPELYRKALERHPGIRKSSFVSRVVACTPDHPSYEHFASRKDFFRYGGAGLYMLKEQYMPDKVTANEPYQSG